MRYDEKAVEQARNIDLPVFLSRYLGFTFISKCNEHRCQEHPSLSIKGDRLTWYWHSRGIGGRGALDFMIKALGMGFRKAMEKLAGAEISFAPRQPDPITARTLILPEKAGFPLRLYDYLCCRRGIDGCIVNALIQEEKIYEDRRGNIVFVGFDEQAKPRFASLRGTVGDCRFRMDCPGSDKRYGFNMAACAASERLYIFESPIDAMSHASLENAAAGDKDAWKRDSRLSLAGTSDTTLVFFLRKHNAVKELVFCLDNDTAGREAAAATARKLAEQGLRTRVALPAGKDFNDDLIALRNANIHKNKGENTPERIEI